MKFLLDENVPVQLKSLIEKAGHQASDVHQWGLNGKDDKSVIETCQKENYVLITNDTDFENIYAYPPGTHCGIIVLRLKSQGVKTVSEAFQKFLEEIDLKKIESAITIIGPDLIKIRKEL